MTYRDGFVEANGIRLHYLDWGGDGPPVLFIHPTGFHAHVWGPFAEHLAGRYRCLAFDTRGHGDSDKPGVYGWTDFAADLEGFVDALSLRGVIGVGHSAGATQILVVASRRPEIFAKAVALDPILFLAAPSEPHVGDTSRLEGTRRRRSHFPSREAAYENYASKPPFNAWEPGLLRLYVEHGLRDEAHGVVLKCPPHDEAEMYRWGPTRLPSEEFLPQVGCPVLLVGGERSDALPPERARRACELLPRCELLTLPTSHFVPFERPQETMAAIDRFLGEA